MVLLSSCGEIEPSSILPASFLKPAILSEDNSGLSCDFENTEPQNTKNTAEVDTKKRCSQLLSKNVIRSFNALDLIDNDLL